MLNIKHFSIAVNHWAVEVLKTYQCIWIRQIATIIIINFMYEHQKWNIEGLNSGLLKSA